MQKKQKKAFDKVQSVHDTNEGLEGTCVNMIKALLRDLQLGKHSSSSEIRQ